jgi:DNA (cytosine-5)-methyltransferase 1
VVQAEVMLRSRESARPTAVDLFCGAGGLSLGFEQAGFDVIAAIDYDPVHALVHKFNFPDCEVLCRDIHNLKGEEIIDAAQRGSRRTRPGQTWRGSVDVVIGGPSCQGFSSGGVRATNDPRNMLFGEFVRLVKEIRPKAFCLENVPGLLESRFDNIRAEAFKSLRSAGYSLSGTDFWYNATDFGVPQSRKRVIVLGVLQGSAPDLLESEGPQSVTVRQALEGLPVIENYPELLSDDEVRLNAKDRRLRIATTSRYARQLSGLDRSNDLSRQRTFDSSILTCSLRTVHGDEIVRRFDSTQPGTVESTSRFYRLSLDGVSRTLRAGTGKELGSYTSPRPIHPTFPRVITVREAARLHGYPDWFRFSSVNWHGHRQVGNSVPPPIARAAARRLLKTLGSSPRRPRIESGLGDSSWCKARPQKAAEFLKGTRP